MKFKKEVMTSSSSSSSSPNFDDIIKFLLQVKPLGNGWLVNGTPLLMVFYIYLLRSRGAHTRKCLSSNSLESPCLGVYSRLIISFYKQIFCHLSQKNFSKCSICFQRNSSTPRLFTMSWGDEERAWRGRVAATLGSF